MIHDFCNWCFVDFTLNVSGPHGPGACCPRLDPILEFVPQESALTGEVVALTSEYRYRDEDESTAYWGFQMFVPDTILRDIMAGKKSLMNSMRKHFSIIVPGLERQHSIKIHAVRVFLIVPGKPVKEDEEW